MQASQIKPKSVYTIRYAGMADMPVVRFHVTALVTRHADDYVEGYVDPKDVQRFNIYGAVAGSPHGDKLYLNPKAIIGPCEEAPDTRHARRFKRLRSLISGFAARPCP